MTFRTLGTVAAASLALASVSAHAAPVAADRAGAPVEASEQFGGMGTGLLAALLAAALIAFVIIASDDDNDNDLPTSP